VFSSRSKRTQEFIFFFFRAFARQFSGPARNQARLPERIGARFSHARPKAVLQVLAEFPSVSGHLTRNSGEGVGADH